MPISVRVIIACLAISCYLLFAVIIGRALDGVSDDE